MASLASGFAGLCETDQVFCPECGYNLRGIPENRCPECGFGYEHAAIRAIAELHAQVRLRTYSRSLWFTSLGLICLTLAHAGAVSQGTLGEILLIALGLAVGCTEVCLFCCMAFWAALGARFFSSQGKLWLSVLLLPPAVVLALGSPEFCKCAAGAAAALAMSTYVHLPRQFPKAEASLPWDRQKQLRRRGSIAWAALALMTGAAVLTWA